MKKFQSPAVEVRMLKAANIITTSGVEVQTNVDLHYLEDTRNAWDAR